MSGTAVHAAARRAKPMHPTKERLLSATVELLDDYAPEAITVDMVHSATSISLGSMYHHYRDLADLVEAALAFRFASYVDQSIVWLHSAMETSTTSEEFFENLKRVTRGTQARELAHRRLERAGILHRTANSPVFRERLGREQQRLTDEITSFVAMAQERGWVTDEVDPRTAAVLIQAYTLGRAVDDITSAPMDDDAWILLIDRIADRVFRP